MIFLSKDGKDPYINMLAASQNCQPTNTEDFVFDDNDEPIVLRGILKHKIIHNCWQRQRTFYFVDTGYFGNDVNNKNPNGRKLWHRIVKNNLQHHELIKRPPYRWQTFFGHKSFTPWRRGGRSIMIAAPDEKPCRFYGIDRNQWIQDVKNQIQAHSDRPIVIRERAPLRHDRMLTNTLAQAIKQHDVFALVTYNSVAATEAVFLGIPVFVLAPVNAAAPVARTSLDQIENPFYADQDLLHQWVSHLAYGQFHEEEMRGGRAWHIIKETT